MSKHIIIIRHFKTDKYNKINYNTANNDAELFIKTIMNYIINNNINEVRFITSPQERTILTSLIICNILKDNIKDINILNPIINNIIDRDPKHNNKHEIQKYFKSIVKNYTKNTLYIYITHSSVYHTIFQSIVNILNEKKYIKKEKIYHYSLSIISFNSKELYYKFNIDMLNKN